MKRICLCCGKPLNGENESSWHEECVKRFFDSPSIPDFSNLMEEANSFAKSNLDSGIAVTGVQKKLSYETPSLKRKRKTVNQANFILKFPEKRYPDLPEYEQLLMNMAESSHIKTVPHALIHAGSGYVYITKRIDRVAGRRLPMEDFCQLCGKITEQKYDSSYEYCHRKALRYSSALPLDSIRFYELILFSYLTGNTDLHLKNFSLIDFGQGHVLSPAYDLVPSEVIANQDEMALSLNGKRKNLTINDFLSFGEYVGLKEDIADNLIKRMLGNKDKWIESITNSLLGEEKKKEYIEFLENRFKMFSKK